MIFFGLLCSFPGRFENHIQTGKFYHHTGILQLYGGELNNIIARAVKVYSILGMSCNFQETCHKSYYILSLKGSRDLLNFCGQLQQDSKIPLVQDVLFMCSFGIMRISAFRMLLLSVFTCCLSEASCFC